MILVDSSVLIAFLKGSATAGARKFREILDHQIPFGIPAIVYQEVLQGARSEKEYKLIRGYLGSQRFFHPKDPVDSYAKAAKIYFDCRRKGVSVRSTIDCLIAQIAMEHDLLLLHEDRDYEAMSAVAPLRFY
jgi:predicted nucleic acid-binding protein